MKALMLLIIMFVISLFAQDIISKQNRESPHSIKDTLTLPQVPSITNLDVVSNVKYMFEDGEFNGQFITMYAGYNAASNAIGSNQNAYSTSNGGKIKYALAKLDGFNAAVALYASRDIFALSGDINQGHQNYELSSSSGKYTSLAEAYINYNNGNFNLRAGRQVLQNPLVDNDPIRIIQDTYEAYILTYLYGDLTFTAGNVEKWQGYDAGLINHFITVGQNGLWLGGVEFSNKNIDSSLWIYNILDMTNATYTDVSYHVNLTPNLFLQVSAQYINEQEIKNSGISANVYGSMMELIYHRFNIFAAYNASIVPRHKQSFSAFGGGPLYTSMDTMIIDNIAVDRDAQAFVISPSYTYKNLSFIYAYGRFTGNANSQGAKANTIEQDARVQYKPNDKLTLALMTAVYNDVQNPSKSGNHWKRLEGYIEYNF